MSTTINTTSALLKFKQVMARLQVSRSTLYRRIYGGEITPFKIGTGKHLFFYSEDVEALLHPANMKRAS